MNLRKSFAAISMLLAGSFSLPAAANIIYNNGAPDTSNGFSINGPIGGSGGDWYTTADDFSLSSAATVSSVGFYFQNYTGIAGWDGNVDYAIRADTGGTPGAILTSGSGQNVTASLSAYPWCCGGGNAWLVTFDLASSFSASASTTYWLNLGGAGGPGGYAWWVTTSGQYTGNGLRSYDGSNFEYIEGYEFSFYLSDGVTAPVPEPETYAMLLAGLGLLGFAARRRKQKEVATA